MRHLFAVLRFILTGIVALLLVLLLAGCTVGPKYVKPTVPTTPAYKEEVPDSFKSQTSGSLRSRATREAAETGGRFLAIRNSTSWKSRSPVPTRT